MNPDTYELQHADVEQPKLHDGECATRDWPLPEARAWKPTPRSPVVTRILERTAAWWREKL